MQSRTRDFTLRSEAQDAQTCNGTRPPYRRLNSTRTTLGSTRSEGQARHFTRGVYAVPKKSLAIPTFAPCAIELVTCAEAKYILGGISTATLYRGIASGRYPAPLKVGPN